MNFSALGGITVFVVAALWVLVYIPGWTNQSQNRDQTRNAKRQASENSRQSNLQRRVEKRDTPNPLAVARRIEALTLRVRLWGSLALLSLASVFGVAIAGGGLNETWMPVSLCFAVSVFSIFRFRRTNLERGRLTLLSIQRRAERAAQLSSHGLSKVEPIVVEEVLEDPRAWTPNTLPNPIHMSQVGELNLNDLAEIIEIPKPKKVSLDSQQVDEILRRRRSIG
jgi:hypothetical protein